MRFLIVLRGGAIAAILGSLLIPQIHAQTQAEMNATAREDFARADADLNKTYQAVLKKVPDAESKQKLKEAQRAWIASRDAEAARAADEVRGGSMAPTLRYETMTELTRQRIKQLEPMLTSNAAPDEKDTSTPSPTPPPTATSSASAQESDKEPASEAPNPSSASPDKKWEYLGGEDQAKIVATDTKQMVLDLSEQGLPGHVLWAPDSKRFAFNWGRGRTHQTALYQLRDDHWVALKFPGDGDEIQKQADDIVAGQLKKEGLSQKKLEKQGKFLRLIWWTVQVDRWLDSNTAIVYASLRQVAALREAPGEMDNGYGIDLLFTLKFDPSGKWKIVKIHRMSEKEVEEHL